MKDFQKENRIQSSEASKQVVLGAEENIENTAQPNIARMLEEYGGSLLRLCFMYVRDMQLAEDAVQETFLKVHKYYFRFQGEGGTQGERNWVTRIAVNVCKDMLRSAWRRKVNVVEELNDIPDESPQQSVEDETLLKTVMELKPKYREVILLFYYEDMKISDISQMLNTPESTISVRLKRAREQLKKSLGGWYYGGEE